MKSAILSAALLASVMCVHAQVSFGPEVSLIGTNYTGKTDGRPNVTKSIASYRVGGVVDIPISNHISIQPALQYVQNGYKFDVIAVNVTAHINTMEIPVNVMYNIPMRGGDHFFVGLGPYIAYNISGKYKQSEDSPYGTQSGPLNIGSGPDDGIKTIDFGLGLNAGYQLTDRLFLRAYYQKGVLNLDPRGNSNEYIRNTNYGIGIGMLLGGSHAHHAKAKKK